MSAEKILLLRNIKTVDKDLKLCIMHNTDVDYNVGVAEWLRVGLQIRSMQVRVLSPTPN